LLLLGITSAPISRTILQQWEEVCQ
jgi:hypothetical protein